MPAKQQDVVHLSVVLLSPPGDIDYGVQQGPGNDYEVLQIQRSTGKDLLFTFPVNVKIGKDGAYQLAGTIVQGKPGERFLYIDIGTYAGQKNTIWARRMKVPLPDSMLTSIEKLINNKKLLLETKVQGTDKKGEPACATVKLIDGWKIKDAEL